MAINRLPISTERLDFVFVSVEAKSDFESGVQKLDRDGVPQWKCTLLLTSPEQKAETCECTISAKAEPSIPSLTPVMLDRPVAVLWQQGTRAGLAISAQGIRPANAPKSSPANGAQPEPVKS